jgi:hypothetical protein
MTTEQARFEMERDDFEEFVQSQESKRQAWRLE